MPFLWQALPKFTLLAEQFHQKPCVQPSLYVIILVFFVSIVPQT